jgi:hypothetical protein
MSRLSNILVAVALIGVLAPSQALAQLCWVARVNKTDTGIKIFFGGTHVIHVNGPSGKYDLWVDGVGTEAPATGAKPRVVNAVAAKVGDHLGVWNSPEDACEMQVVLRNGAIGLVVHASFHPQMMLPDGVVGPASDRTEFVPAQ